MVLYVWRMIQDSFREFPRSGEARTLTDVCNVWARGRPLAGRMDGRCLGQLVLKLVQHDRQLLIPHLLLLSQFVYGVFPRDKERPRAVALGARQRFPKAEGPAVQLRLFP